MMQFDDGYCSLASCEDRFGMQVETAGDSACLKSVDGRDICVTFDTAQASVCGTVVYLSYPIVKNRLGMLGISQVDVDTLLTPILNPKKRSVKHIVIDAGHGGEDTGAAYFGVNEKDMNLDVATRLQALLLAKGYKVTMTRTTDVTLPLEQRPKIINAVKPDLVICVHFNAASSLDAKGIEVYVPNPANVPSFLGAMGVDAPCCKFTLENALLGYTMQKALIEGTKLDDRGLRRVQHYVTRNSNCPAILVELGFLSNKDEFAVISTHEYKEKIAKIIAEAIDY